MSSHAVSVRVLLFVVALAAACKASPAPWEPIDRDFKGCEGG
jgi:hypothetical protein